MAEELTAKCAKKRENWESCDRPPMALIVPAISSGSGDERPRTFRAILRFSRLRPSSLIPFRNCEFDFPERVT